MIPPDRPDPFDHVDASATVSAPPRFVVAAPASGQGKTTVTIGLIAALRRVGHDVAPFKVGPDYIDPGYHLLAAGRPGRNLDPFLVGEDAMLPLFLHGALRPTPCDLAVVEGVMGLFDGRLGTGGFASTGHVAALLRAPVVLVLDTRHTSRTIGAVAHGLATWDAEVSVAGVVLNQCGSARHAAEATAAIRESGLAVLGVLGRHEDLHAPSRHLGLVPAAERPQAATDLDRLADRIAADVDLAAIVDVARRAPALAARPWDPEAVITPPTLEGSRPVVAMAGGRAFTFRYAETSELLEAAGCEVAVFDPLVDADLPAGTRGLYLGGGFPEVHAGELSGNEVLRARIRAAVAAGMPTVAECAGLLYLCSTLDGVPMTGALPATARMTPRLTLGYREAVAPADTLLARAGERVTGHEFHRTTVDVPRDTGTGIPPAITPAWLLDGRPDGVSADPAGSGMATLHASYLHVHWAGHPQVAQRFADAVHRYAPTPTPAGAL